MSFVSTAIETAPTAAAPVVRVRGHMPPLDGLRGIAVVSVIAHHIMNSASINWGFGNRLTLPLEYGWAGVDLFFVLSGFLITGILYDSKGTTNYFRNFYARRTLRIMPLYYLGVLVLLVLAAAGVGAQGNVSIWWVITYLTNVVISIGPDNSVGWLGHYWSLAVEEHYYLVWPAFVFLFGRRTLINIALGAIVVALTLRVLVVTFEPFAGDSAAYMLTPMRMDSLAAGSLLALLARSPEGAGKLLRPAFVLAALSGLGICAMIAITGRVDFLNPVVSTIGYSLNAAFFASVLMISLAWRPASIAASQGVLRWFGKYSYGLYVWHPIVFMFVFHSTFTAPLRNGGAGHALLTVSLAVGATILVALLSWHLMEKQFLKLKGRFSPHHHADAAEAPQLGATRNA
jgi:peptidoglycan/LPS O-acetylase OafA/YrhL